MGARVQKGVCGRTLLSLVAGSFFLAAIPQTVPASSVIYWGRDYYGQFNVPPGLNNAVAVGAGYQHCVALRGDGSVAVWGQNGDGQLNVSAAVSNNVVALRAGWYHTLALLNNGSVVGWGAGLTNALTGHNYGQCLVPPNVTNPLDFAAGRYFSMALLSDRTVAVWGENLYGQTNVPSGLTNVSAIAAGGLHCLALKGDGTVVAWGGNGSGECNVPASLSNVVAIAAGYYNSYALQADGSVVIWGDNTEQQDIVPAGVSNVVLATGGAYYSMVVEDSGQPVAWDFDSFLGHVLPEAILPAGLTNVTGITAGFYMGLAVTNDGTPVITYQPANRSVFSGNDFAFRALVAGAPPMACQWFFNGAPLANATNAALPLPAVQTNQAGLYSFVASNSLGSVSSSSALLTVIQQLPLLTAQPASLVTYRYGPASFTSAAIGSQPLSFQWQLNGTNLDGATNALLSYAHVVPQQPGNYSVVVSNQFGVATSTNASLTILAVLDNGNGNYNYNHYPVPTSLTDAVAIAAGNFHSLALKADHTLVSWGANTSHQLDIPASATNILAIAAGGNNSLVLRSNGTVVEWGDNYSGQTNVPANLANVVAVAVGDNHALALRNNGTVVAWGLNGSGQTNVPASATNIIAVAAGSAHSLVLRSNGTLLAWGSNSYGQTNIPSGLTNVIAISAAYNHNLVLKADGNAVAWGDFGTTFSFNDIVALGSGNYSGASYFAFLHANGTVSGGYVGGVSNATAIACGAAHNLVLLGDGSPCLYWPPKVWPTATPGDTVSTRVLVSGNGPMYYQWQLNGLNLVGATNATLTLTNIPLTSAGVYRCIISNALGTVITAGITLDVKRVLPLLVSAGSRAAPLTSNGFKLHVSGLAGQGALVVYASTNLVDWLPIQTNPPTVGTLDMVDPGATNQSPLFYRAVEGP